MLFLNSSSRYHFRGAVQAAKMPLFALVALSTLIPAKLAATPPEIDVPRCRAAMKQAAQYFRQEVGYQGGYVYFYSDDLSQRWGEGAATKNTAFVEPPGTPTVAMAFLAAFRATQDPFFLNAARESAAALIQAQLPSGGWRQSFQIPAVAPKASYEHLTTLDDNQTQSAILFLMELDLSLQFQDQAIHQATQRALKALLEAQFPCGAFPQVFLQPVAEHPVLQARFPERDWRSEGRVKNYWDYYTLNDNLAGNVANVLVRAHEIYDQPRFLEAIERLGDFLLLAQMPEPQPGWCQQYDYEMFPIWARKFEPPAIATYESQDVMRTLLRIARYTNDPKYVATFPQALEYFQDRSPTTDGLMPRYLELKSNRPLYMNSKYELTYDDNDLPPHYGWKQPNGFQEIRRDYQAYLKGESTVAPRKTVDPAKIERILDTLDEQGRWVSVYDGERLTGQPKFAIGFRYLSSALFSENLTALAAAVSP